MLESVDKNQIAHRLEPSTRTHYDEFWMCERCDNVYWRGAHIASIERFVQEVASATVESTTRPIQSGS